MFTDVIIYLAVMAFKLTLKVHNSLSNSSFILTIYLLHKCIWEHIMNIAL